MGSAGSLCACGQPCPRRSHGGDSAHVFSSREAIRPPRAWSAVFSCLVVVFCVFVCCLLQNLLCVPAPEEIFGS